MGEEAGQEEPATAVPRESELHQPGPVHQRRGSGRRRGSAARQGCPTGRRRAEDRLQPQVPLHEVQGEAQQARRRGTERGRARDQRPVRKEELCN